MAVVVTRHPALVAYLEEIGLIQPGAVVIAQATPEQIRGQHVVGVLPIPLAALCEKVTMVPLDVPAELRGKELSLQQVRELAGPPETFKVTKV